MSFYNDIYFGGSLTTGCLLSCTMFVARNYFGHCTRTTEVLCKVDPTESGILLCLLTRRDNIWSFRFQLKNLHAIGACSLPWSMTIIIESHIQPVYSCSYTENLQFVVDSGICLKENLKNWNHRNPGRKKLYKRRYHSFIYSLFSLCVTTFWYHEKPLVRTMVDKLLTILST